MVNKEHTTLSQRRKAEFHAALSAWYAAHGRHGLPWRNTADPYAIYVSEIMLQQTQVETVRQRYYGPFLKQFPTLAALAKAKREDVLKAWQGLGYYTRAANLHKAAQKVGDWGLGIWDLGEVPFHSPTPNPQTLIPTLLSLPGIGQNTAHAIAAFAYHVPVPVMEANVKRVLSRIFALQDAPDWTHAEALLDAQNPFDYNQAMMDLGAMICTRRAPKCNECPARGICKGKAAPELYPTPKRGKKTPVRRRTIVVQMDAAGRVYATPRTEKFLHGMYQFVGLSSLPLREGVRGRGRNALTPTLTLPRKGGGNMVYLGHITQAYSHFTLEAEVYLSPATSTSHQHSLPATETGGWFTLAQFKKLPHSKAEEKILSVLESPLAPAHRPARSPRGRHARAPSAR